MHNPVGRADCHLLPPAGQCPVPFAAAGQNTNPAAIYWSGWVLRRAVPGSTCCRRIEHEPSRHKSERLGSSVFRDSPENSCRRCRPGRARSHLLPPIPATNSGTINQSSRILRSALPTAGHKKMERIPQPPSTTASLSGGAQTVETPPRRAREGRSPFELSIVPSGMYGGHGAIFSPENPIFQRKNRFLAGSAPEKSLIFSGDW